MTGLSCTTCRMIRRFTFAFVLGCFVAWQMTGTLPFAIQDPAPLQGLMMVVIIFVAISIFMRMNSMRRRWKR